MEIRLKFLLGCLVIGTVFYVINWVILMALGVLFGSAFTAITSPSYTLSVIVDDSHTGRALPNATVTVYNVDGWKVTEGMTDESGRVSLTLRGDRYRIMASLSGYGISSKWVLLDSDREETVSIDPTPLLVLSLHAYDSRANRAIVGASVSVKDVNDVERISGATDESGIFATDPLEEGTYTYEVTHINYDAVAATVTLNETMIVDVPMERIGVKPVEHWGVQLLSIVMFMASLMIMGFLVIQVSKLKSTFEMD